MPSAEVRATAASRRVPGSSPADGSFWANLAENAQNDPSVGLELGTLRLVAVALTSALAVILDSELICHKIKIDMPQVNFYLAHDSVISDY